jgi:xanthine dehydrogenase molybdenum-binding subunit
VGIYTGYTEMGQGYSLFSNKLPAKKLGFLRASSALSLADTKYPLDCGQTTGSRGTFLGCRGVQEAARKLKADLDSKKSLSDLAGKTYYGEVLIDDTVSLEAKVEKPKTHFAYGFATQVVILMMTADPKSGGGA